MTPQFAKCRALASLWPFVGVLLCISPFSSAMAGELGDLLRNSLQHPQVRAAANQTEAAQAQSDAATGRYFGSAIIAAGWHGYEDKRVVGLYAPGAPILPLVSDRIVQSGVNYSLPVDVFGVIAANQERAGHDLRAAGLLGRQQALLKMHQAATAYLTLQSLLKQREALMLSRKRVEITYQRVRREFELGKAAGVDARYAEAELARLNADEAVLTGAMAQAQADFAEATGRSQFLPTVSKIHVPRWETGSDDSLAVQIAEARQQSAQALADESRRSLFPTFAIDANYFRNSVPGGDHRDTWAIGAVVSVPLSVSQRRQVSAQEFTAAAAADQREAAARDAERQLASLRAAHESGLADAAAMESEVSYREEISHVQQTMQQLGNQTLENLFRHERDLLDARYRLAQASARAAAAWSAAQVVNGLAPEVYISQMDAQ